MLYPKLYKRTSTGKTQVWWAEKNNDAYRVHSGQMDGKIVTSEWTAGKAKNIGKSNATTPEEQVVSEIASAYELKKKKGYHDNPDDAQRDESIRPMLAKKYEDYAEDLFKNGNYVFSQPKLDGIRCIATREGLFSRQGNKIIAVPHIEKEVLSFFSICGIQFLDGELYSHSLKNDFNKIVSLVKKQKPTKEELKEAENIVEYHIYDCFPPKFIYDKFEQRNAHLTEKLASIPGFDFQFLKKVVTGKIFTQKQLDTYYESYIDQGYEGQIVRLNGFYEQKRSNLLLKRKEFQDAEFTIIDLQEGDGNASGMVKRAILKLSNEKTFKADVVGEREKLRKLLEQKHLLIGKQATVEYFNLTPDGVPRFPKLKIIHLEGRW